MTTNETTISESEHQSADRIADTHRAAMAENIESAVAALRTLDYLNRFNSGALQLAKKVAVGKADDEAVDAFLDNYRLRLFRAMVDRDK